MIKIYNDLDVCMDVIINRMPHKEQKSLMSKEALPVLSNEIRNTISSLSGSHSCWRTRLPTPRIISATRTP